jgi:hypothetical protein
MFSYYIDKYTFIFSLCTMNAEQNICGRNCTPCFRILLPFYTDRLAGSAWVCVCEYIYIYINCKVKVKLKLSLCLTKHHAMKTYCGVEVQLHAFLISVLDGGEWSASRPGRFTARERAPGTRWIGGWVGPRAVLDAVKRKILSPRRESNPRTPIIQPVAQRYIEL